MKKNIDTNKIQQLKQSIRNYKKTILKNGKREKVINDYREFLSFCGFTDIDKKFSEKFLYMAGLKHYYKKPVPIVSETEFFKKYVTGSN
jgi:hypothetical protein